MGSLWELPLYSKINKMKKQNYYIRRTAKKELALIAEAKERMNEQLQRRELPDEPQTKITEFTKKNPDYWVKYNRARTSEKRMFYMLLDDLLNTIPDTTEIGANGRPPIKIRDLLFCSALKIYNNFSARRISSDLDHCARMGFVNKVPHFNTLLVFMNNKFTQDLIKHLITLTALPFSSIEKDFAIDASGFGSFQYGKWMNYKYGDPTERGTRNYVKCHISVGIQTHIISAAEVTTSNESDTKHFPYLINKTAENFVPEKVLADKAYSSRKNFQIIEALNALPLIPFKCNATGTSKGCPTWHAAYEYFTENRNGFKYFYRQRSQVESAFSMIKTNFGSFLKCKNFESQRNEVLLKCLCHNISCLVSEIVQRGLRIDFECESKKIIKKRCKSFCD